MMMKNRFAQEHKKLTKVAGNKPGTENDLSTVKKKKKKLVPNEIFIFKDTNFRLLRDKLYLEREKNETEILLYLVD